MSDNIFTLSCGAETAIIHHPIWGYKTTVDMSLRIRRKADGHDSIYDPGTTYDIRTFTGTFQLTATEQLDLEALLNLKAQGRSQTITATLDADSGFYPFGPDLGDAGAFTLAVLPPTYQGVGEAPYKYFNTEMTWIMISKPAYAIPADSNVEYGNVTVGTIANLKFPDGWFRPENEVKYNVTTTNNPANTKQVDFGESGDIYDTSVTLNCGNVKAANLVNYLTGTARGAAFNIIPPTDGYIFGRTKLSTATYSCYLANRSINITHNNHDNFDIDFTVNLA